VQDLLRDGELKIEVYIIDLKKETCNTANSTTAAALSLFEELLWIQNTWNGTLPYTYTYMVTLSHSYSEFSNATFR
jgi:hypothetical protein